MYWQQPVRQQLLRLALVTSPLLAIFRMTPVAIFNRDEFREAIGSEQYALAVTLVAGTILSLTIFVLWLINIWLFTKEIDKPETARAEKNQLRLYIYSFLGAVSFLVLPLILDPIVSVKFGLQRPAGLSFYPLVGTLANNAVILLILNLVLTRDNESRLALSNMQLEVSNLMAQQAQLKHQLQPHFLFNALYTLQLLIGKDADQAKRYLQRLSGFLRRSIQYARQDTISVQEELQFCEDYLALQKVRFGEGLNYTVELNEQQKQGGLLPIFTLQILVENAIKHNAFDAENPLHIQIKTHEGQSLLVENNMLPKKTSLADSNGFGLHNLRERYQLLSPNGPRVETSQEDLTFRAYVPILPK
ncbi:MAG: histidine kinase [Bacteroidota bacterium]